MYNYIFKPLLDFSISFIGLVLLSPVFLIITLLLSIANNGSAFFIQARPGKNGKIFHIIKFKTMTDKVDIDGNLLPDEMRLTTLGNIIRKTSIDEIPQLLNVFMGHMSLIGPRPLRVEYLSRYNAEQRRRHNVKPGITGWAQVNGRNNITWKQKFEYDIWYVDNISLTIDMKIIYLTFLKVFKEEDINLAGHATTTEFKGNNQ